MWPGVEVNVDAGRRRDAVKAWQSLNAQVGPSCRCGIRRTMYENWPNHHATVVNEATI